MKTAGRIAVAGGELHVDDTGEADLVPVVCLHSLFLDHRQFDAFAAAASGQLRIIRPDFRGQGRSSGAVRDIITVESCAGDIQALLDKLGVTEAHFLVSSMGGDVGLRVAAHRPDLIRSMVITGSSARAEPPGQLREFLQWVEDVGKRGFTDDVLRTTMRIMLGETTLRDPAKRDVVDLWTARIAALKPGLKPAMAGVIRRRSALDLLEDITVPALVISGEECIARPSTWAKELAASLPDAQLWMMSEIGHSPLLEEPDLVNQRVLAFFREH
ncbi:alpha/beta fold hydrolase [Micromonospora sp. NPDC092111]|uniref:alpha/beta fold hydrolase n=1 Tax=Micromonospora sp. NPDC092111 TaxID=3364289 RepID=UPI003811038E